jgi:hypothetical protein
MRKHLMLAVVLAALSATGCASYASERLVAPDEAVKQREIFGDIEAREFGKKAELKLPSELVVADMRAKSTRGREAKSDKRTVQLVDSLAGEKATFANVEPMFVDAWSAKYGDLRSTASRHHADLMLVASMTESVENENNLLLGAMNLLIVPAFVVPTRTQDLALHLRVAVIDVRNDLVYATFEDHREERVHATAVGESDAVEECFDRLYADSLAKMKGRIVERLKNLEAAPD